MKKTIEVSKRMEIGIFYTIYEKIIYSQLQY